MRYIAGFQLIAHLLLMSLFLQSCFNADRFAEDQEGKNAAIPVSKYVNQGQEKEQPPIIIFPTAFISTKKLSYQILPQITMETAQEVQEQTGLVIPFRTGKTTIGFIGGRGFYGQLRLGMDVDTGRYYGVKILQPRSYELKEEVRLKEEARLVEEARKEALLQSKLNGLPHLMPIIDIGETKDANNKAVLYQVMPLAGLGNGAQLADYLKTISNDPAFKESLLIHVAKSILEGFEAMHGLAEPIVHLDFKPDNMVINDKGEVFIIDFGCAKHLSADGKIHEDANGDDDYFSPERKEVREYGNGSFDGKAADNWAIGMTLLELAAGMLTDDDKEALRAGRFDCSKYPLLNNPQPGSYGAMVKGFLSLYPESRLTSIQALAMPLFQQETKPEILVFLKQFVQSTQWNKKKEKMSQQTYGLTSVQQLPLPHFAGYANRPVLEQAVMDQLINGNSPVVACVGMGGVGKSQLLAYLVHQQALQQRFKKIYWFQAADNETSLLIQYKGLAQELKLPGIDEKTPAEEAKIILVKWLERNSPSTLLVFDNADDPALLETFLPKGGACQVLVSSRSPQWSNKVEVDLFTGEQVNQLLHKLLPDRNTTLEEAQLLGEVMGYLPLALNQAIALIREEQKSIADHVKAYQEKRQELLETNKPLFGKDLPHSMVTLYQIQLEKLQKECPEAIALLEYAALVAPDNIPLTLFSKGLLNEETAIETYEKAQQALFNYALWQVDKNEEMFKMHHLMQEVVKLLLQTELLQKRFIELAGCIKKEYDRKTTVLDEETRQKALLPHLEALEQVAKKRNPLNGSIQFAGLLDCMGKFYLVIQGAYKKANFLYEEAFKITTKHYGEDHPQTGSILENLGTVYGPLGNYEKQKELLEKALQIKVKCYGEDHPQIASVLSNLGNAYGDLGDHESQKELLEKALKIDINHYGEEHPNTGQTLMNLATAYGSLGNYEKKKELLEKALKIKIKHYGEDHPETGLALGNLGNVYGSLGNYERKKELLEKDLKITIKHYGAEHIKTGNTLGNLGNAYGSLGNYGKQKELLKQALKIKSKHLGEEHLETGKTLANLGITYGDLGNYEKKKELVKKALKILIKYYGEAHPYTGITLEHLGIAYGSLGNYEKQLGLLEKALKIKIKHYGEDHPETGITLGNLGVAYGDLANYEKERELLEQALAIFKRHYEAQNPAIGETLRSLGYTYGKLGNADIGKQLLEEALANLINHYGAEHTETGMVLEKLGILYQDLNKAEEALKYYQQAYNIFIKHHHPYATRAKELMDNLLTTHPVSQRVSNKNLATLGTTALYLGKYQEAKELLEQALETSINNNSVNHFDTSKILSQVYASLGNYQAENELLNQALEINKKLYATDHPEVGTTLMHMGISYFYLGAYEKAKKALEQAMSIKNNHAEANYPITGMILMYLGLAYKALDQPAKAYSCYQQAYAIFIKYPKLPQASIIKTWLDRMG